MLSKALGLSHPQDCYSKDFPPELIRERVQRIIADNVVKLCCNKRTFWNIPLALYRPDIIEKEK